MTSTLERLNERRKQDEGFTLIELLVVIVIIGILAGVVVFAVRGIADRGETSANESDRRAIATAEEAFYANAASTGAATYASECDLVDGGFLEDASALHDITFVATSPGEYTITTGTAVEPGDC